MINPIRKRRRREKIIASGEADRRNHWKSQKKNKENRKKSDKCLAVLGIPSTFASYEDAQGCVFVVEK